jgi:hypothetical protein
MDQKEAPLHENGGKTQAPETSKTELIKRLKRNEFIDDDTLLDMVSSLQLSESSCRNLITLIEDLQYPEAIAIIEKSC